MFIAWTVVECFLTETKKEFLKCENQVFCSRCRCYCHFKRKDGKSGWFLFLIPTEFLRGILSWETAQKTRVIRHLLGIWKYKFGSIYHAQKATFAMSSTILGGSKYFGEIRGEIHSQLTVYSQEHKRSVDNRPKNKLQ